MTQLFVTLLVLCVLLICVGLIAKKLFSLTRMALTKTKRMKQLRRLTRDNLFDRRTVLRCIRYYIPPKCQERNPAIRGKRKQRYRVKNLTMAVDFFLDRDVRCRHLLILADSGMGKTAFSLNYYCHNQDRPSRNRHTILLVPLNRGGADTAISSCPDRDGTVLFLDGLDEDTEAARDPYLRLRQLTEQTRGFKRIIITCGPDFIQKPKDIPAVKGYLLTAPGDPDNTDMYRVLYMTPMPAFDIIRVLNASLPFWKSSVGKKVYAFVTSKSTPRVTPLMTGWLRDILSETAVPASKNDIYRAIVRHRIRKESVWKDKRQLDLFYRLLARELFLRRMERGEEMISTGDLDQRKREWGLPDLWVKDDLSSLLCRTLDGRVAFIHRSILEYLFVRQMFLGDEACYGQTLTSPMKSFFFRMAGDLYGVDLALEFDWLSRFDLKVSGVGGKPPEGGDLNKSGLSPYLLGKHNRYAFLSRLGKLFENPVFYEFGWHRELYDNLHKAMFLSKTSLMQFQKRGWTVMINPGFIEISKRHRKKEKILVSKKNFREYESLKNNISLIKLNRFIGLSGLRMLHNINQAKPFCALPDLGDLRKFSFYFLTPSERQKKRV